MNAYLKCIGKVLILLLVCVSGVEAATSASNSSTEMAFASDLLFHHHIHNFYLNDSDKSKSNYLVMQNHALAMSYDATTHYLAKSLPGNLDTLKRILLHSAYYYPATIDFTKQQIKYTASYLDSDNRSNVNPERIVWNSYALNEKDLDILKGYGCAQSADYASISTTSTLDDAKLMFRIDKDYGRVIANWQSKFVVEDLAKKTIQSLQIGNYDYLFLDDLIRTPGDCVNKDFGGSGSYGSWKEGQLAFLQKVTDAAHTMQGRKGGQIKVFGNIWSPYADTYTAAWYADKKLRLDHYYFESGGYAKEDSLHGQSSNSTDPETGLPAFTPWNGIGYIPANLVSVGTHITTMDSLATGQGKQNVLDDYMMQHYVAAGIGASQGSWFGWYGETSVDKVDLLGKQIHSNAMQLLRVIPNWENLAKVPLSSRHFDKSANVYTSPNSSFSSTIIQSRNPLSNEIYAVFRSATGQLDLQGRSIDKASFVNSYFNKIEEDALPCLAESKSKITLKCTDKIDQGIRITVK
jgi:hypothetical protein